MPVLAERMAVCGVGLIGGSLAAAARRAGLVRRVVGIGRTRANLQVALHRGLIDEVGDGPAAVAGAELVVLAVPPAALPEVARQAAGHLEPGAVVTDVASIKATVVRQLLGILPARCAYVGSHPIAGNERAGAAAADPDLFRGSTCVLTPGGSVPEDAVRRLESLWVGVGARIVRMSPEEHDRALAWTSHLGHLLAFALARGVAAGGQGLARLAGPSLRDMTRVAASRPELWAEILSANRDAVMEALAALRRDLDSAEQALGQCDVQALAEWLRVGNTGRRLLEEPS